MAESQTVLILREKRAAIAAAITNYERQLEQAKADFVHVTASLEIFEAQDHPHSHRVYVALKGHFRYGEIAEMCRAALRASGSLDTPGLTKIVMETKGLPFENKVLSKTVGFSVLQSMRGMLRRKMVTKTQPRQNGRCVWTQVK